MSTSYTRRAFVQSAGVLGLAGLLPVVRAQAVGGPSLGPDPDLVLAPDEGEVYLIGERQGRVTIKVDRRTKGVETLSLLTEDIAPGDGVPVHKHAAEEELIFIERGHGMMTFGDDEYEVVSGSMALVPRGVWHGLRNEGEDVLRMVFGYTPAGFEDYFRAIGVRPGEPWKGLTGEDWARINAEFGITYRS